MPVLFGNQGQKILRILALLFSVSLMGTVGYHLVEGWPLLDSLFMTLITLTTVGYGEVRTLDDMGRWFTILLMISGIGVVAYSATTLASLVVEAEYRAVIWRRKMEKRIRRVKDHYVVNPAGRKVVIIESWKLGGIINRKEPPRAAGPGYGIAVFRSWIVRRDGATGRVM